MVLTFKKFLLKVNKIIKNKNDFKTYKYLPYPYHTTDNDTYV